MRRIIQKYNTQNGMALAVVVIITAIIAILGFAVLGRAHSEIQQTVNKEKYNQAYYLANSAAQVTHDVISSRLERLNIAMDAYNSLGGKTQDNADAISDLVSKLEYDIIPDTDAPGDIKTMTVSADGEEYLVEITKRLEDEAVPDGPFYLVAEAVAVNPAPARAAVIAARLNPYTEEYPIMVEGSRSISHGDGIRTTGKFPSPDASGLTVKGGNVTAGGSIGTNLTMGPLPSPEVGTYQTNAYDYVPAEIVTPEMVWRETRDAFGNPPADNVVQLGTVNLNQNITLTSKDSGYYSSGVFNKEYTIDLSKGSVVLVIPKLHIENSWNSFKFTVKNDDAATKDKYNFYLFVMEDYIYNGDDDPDDTAGLNSRTSSPPAKTDADFFRNEKNNFEFVVNDISVKDMVKAYVIAYSDGAQKFIFDNNPDLYEPDNPTKLADIPLNAVVYPDYPGPDYLLSSSYGDGPYNEYYDEITVGGNSNATYIHFIMPFCEADFGNSLNLYGSIQAASVKTGHGTVNYIPVESSSLTDLPDSEPIEIMASFNTYGNLMALIDSYTWIKP